MDSLRLSNKDEDEDNDEALMVGEELIMRYNHISRQDNGAIGASRGTLTLTSYR